MRLKRKTIFPICSSTLISHLSCDDGARLQMKIVFIYLYVYNHIIYMNAADTEC